MFGASRPLSDGYMGSAILIVMDELLWLPLFGGLLMNRAGEDLWLSSRQVSALVSRRASIPRPKIREGARTLNSMR